MRRVSSTYSLFLRLERGRRGRFSATRLAWPWCGCSPNCTTDQLPAGDSPRCSKCDRAVLEGRLQDLAGTPAVFCMAKTQRSLRLSCGWATGNLA